jgi:hypothetical protein
MAACAQVPVGKVCAGQPFPWTLGFRSGMAARNGRGFQKCMIQSFMLTPLIVCFGTWPRLSQRRIGVLAFDDVEALASFRRVYHSLIALTAPMLPYNVTVVTSNLVPCLRLRQCVLVSDRGLWCVWCGAMRTL